MYFRAFKYASPLLLFALAWVSFSATGLTTFLPVIWSYLLIPLAELFIKPNPHNLHATEEMMAKQNRLYDWMLYIVVPLHYALAIYFLISLQQPGLTWADYTGRMLSMGLLCGVFGINVAHELGHRVKPVEQFLAKSLLLTALYMHFFIEHNRGHHKRVGTPADPGTARRNEWLFAFYVRAVTMGFAGAWHIANSDVRKKGLPVITPHNQMVRFMAIQFVFLAMVGWLFGALALVCYVASAAIGIALLETVNYIEHYGLQRQQVAPGKYERAMPIHSWNSNHVLGRLMLFELSRHSDHHYLASRKYQVLRHHPQSPQMPTGYPGMMLLALVPPLFIHIMNRRIAQFNHPTQQYAAGPATGYSRT